MQKQSLTIFAFRDVLVMDEGLHVQQSISTQADYTLQNATIH